MYKSVSKLRCRKYKGIFLIRQKNVKKVARVSRRSRRSRLDCGWILPEQKKSVILRYVLVRGNAINRESGENPEQTRYCNSLKTHRHNATVGLADGKASVSGISQETCHDNI